MALAVRALWGVTLAMLALVWLLGSPLLHWPRRYDVLLEAEAFRVAPASAATAVAATPVATAVSEAATVAASGSGAAAEEPGELNGQGGEDTADGEEGGEEDKERVDEHLEQPGMAEDSPGQDASAASTADAAAAPSPPPSPMAVPPPVARVAAEVAGGVDSGASDVRGDGAPGPSAIVSLPPDPASHRKSKREKNTEDAEERGGRANSSECNCQKSPGCVYFKTAAMGRLGNRIGEMMHAVYHMNLTASGSGMHIDPGYIKGLFELPAYLCVRSERWDQGPVKLETPRRCTEGSVQRMRWYKGACSGDTSAEYKELSRQYLLPYMAGKLASCLRSSRGIDEDRLLTIHLRGGDIFGKHVKTGDYDEERVATHSHMARIMKQPPCALYEKVISEGLFDRVLMVSSQDLANPCFEWLKGYRLRARNREGRPVRIEVQTGTLTEDVCSIWKARHFVLSDSSLSHNLIGLSEEVRSVFLERRFDKDTLLTCPTPNVQFSLYDVPRVSRRGEPLDPETGQGLKVLNTTTFGSWMQTLDARHIKGPFGCDSDAGRGKHEQDR